MGRSTEDWQSYRLGERIIHTPAVHGAGWQALGWQRRMAWMRRCPQQTREKRRWLVKA
jgi:hypothetical protein